MANEHVLSHSVPFPMFRPSSEAPHFSAEPSFDEAHETNWHVTEVEIDPHLCPEEHCPNTRFRRNRPPRFATLAELSASIAHQLNQPLTSMLANAQAAKRWLAAEPPNLVEAVASIDRIARDARTAGETMERIRALFKQESLDKREASIADIMSEAVRVVLEDPNKREVPIRWHSNQNLPKVWVDPLAIQEVFINLISNALEALEDKRDSPLVKVQAAVKDENEMVMQVIDNGPGIGETKEIFEAFVTTKKTGLGIGLAVSRLITEAHGGRLWAENNPSGGATFCLALPLNSRNQRTNGGSSDFIRFIRKKRMKQEKVEQRLHIPNTLLDSNSVRSEQVPVHGLPVQLHKHRILCVDDEIPGTRMRAEILREHGYSVVLYHSPLAVLHCDLSMFDLAILDFQMPGLDGRELFLRMRALGARFPIVLLTGCVEALSDEDVRLFARCLDKGMPIHYLLDTIAEFLEPNQVPDYGS